MQCVLLRLLAFPFATLCYSSHVCATEHRGTRVCKVAKQKQAKKTFLSNSLAQNNLSYPPSFFLSRNLKSRSCNCAVQPRKHGDADAQYNLRYMHERGKGVQQDDAEAAKCYKLAADQGLAGAQCNPGVMHKNGEGMRQDDAEAVKYLKLAADQGHATAQSPRSSTWQACTAKIKVCIKTLQKHASGSSWPQCKVMQVASKHSLKSKMPI